MTDRLLSAPEALHSRPDLWGEDICPGISPSRRPIWMSLRGRGPNEFISGVQCAQREFCVDASELARWTVGFAWATETERCFMGIVQELKGQYDEAETLWRSYIDRLNKFRSQIKNDVVSIEAAARKTTEAVNRMSATYSSVIAQLNSPEMHQAIANAERLAGALAALSNLQSHKLVFSVGDNQQQSTNGAERRT